MKQFLPLKKLRNLLLIGLSALALGELFARLFLGLGEVPVYIEDSDYEYIYAPLQDVTRFGNRILTNEHSMRSTPLTSNDEIRIMKIGDSIINGGSRTDHDSLASSLLEKELSKRLKKRLRVLNVGANSWGPDNAHAYLQKHSHFNSRLIIAVFSSHDFYDNRHFKKVVGVHPAWPSHQPATALTDGLFKYVIPKIKSSLFNKSDYDYLTGVRDTSFNQGWNALIQYAEKNQVPLWVYLHPEKGEAANGKYNANGLKLLNHLEQRNIKVIQGISYGFKDGDYRDHIHLSSAGQKKLAAALKPQIEKYIYTLQ